MVPNPGLGRESGWSVAGRSVAAANSRTEWSGMNRYILLYAATVPVFFVIDLVWLGLVARDFYRDQLGSLMADPIGWPVALLKLAQTT